MRQLKESSLKVGRWLFRFYKGAGAYLSGLVRYQRPGQAL